MTASSIPEQLKQLAEHVSTRGMTLESEIRGEGEVFLSFRKQTETHRFRRDFIISRSEVLFRENWIEAIITTAEASIASMEARLGMGMEARA